MFQYCDKCYFSHSSNRNPASTVLLFCNAVTQSPPNFLPLGSGWHYWLTCDQQNGAEMMQFLRQDQKNPSIFTLLSWDACSLDTPSPKAPVGSPSQNAATTLRGFKLHGKASWGSQLSPTFPSSQPNHQLWGRESLQLILAPSCPSHHQPFKSSQLTPYLDFGVQSKPSQLHPAWSPQNLWAW